MEWTRNLYEVGAPIRDAAQLHLCRAWAQRIAYSIADADKALSAAQSLYAEQMAAIKADAARLESVVAGLWTREEIASAKRGFMLVDGKEIALCR